MLLASLQWTFVRIGVAFGPPLGHRFANKEEDPDFGNRGLLFLSIQTFIEDQFEFLMAVGMGDPSRPTTPAGHDMRVGQNDEVDEGRERRCVIFGAEGNMRKSEPPSRGSFLPEAAISLCLPSPCIETFWLPTAIRIFVFKIAGDNRTC